MPKNRFLFIDLIRALAIFGVISIHTTNYLVFGGNYTHGWSWWLIAILATVVRVSVPLFFMVSGLLILNSEKTLNFSSFYKKIINRLALPLLFWFGFYWLWSVIFLGKNLDATKMIGDFLIVKTNHLYFLQALIGLYLVSPFIILFNKTATEKSKFIFLVLAFILGIGTTFVHKFIFPNSFTNVFNIWNEYLGYFYAGYFFSNLKTKQIKFLPLGFLYLTALLTTLAAINQNWFGIGEFYWNYLTPNIIIMTLTVFSILKNLEVYLQNKLNPISLFFIHQISLSSYGIYITHIFVMDLVDKYSILQIHFVKDNLWFWQIKYLFVVFMISWLITKIIVSIPILKRTVGESN